MELARQEVNMRKPKNYGEMQYRNLKRRENEPPQEISSVNVHEVPVPLLELVHPTPASFPAVSLMERTPSRVNETIASGCRSFAVNRPRPRSPLWEASSSSPFGGVTGQSGGALGVVPLA